MPVLLSISIQSPLTPEDHDLLTGVAVMTLAIANHELANEKFPDTFDHAEPTQTEEAPKAPKAKKQPKSNLGSPCGMVEESTQFSCVSPVGHRGRHRFRDPMGDAVHGGKTDDRLN